MRRNETWSPGGSGLRWTAAALTVVLVTGLPGVAQTRPADVPRTTAARGTAALAALLFVTATAGAVRAVPASGTEPPAGGSTTAPPAVAPWSSPAKPVATRSSPAAIPSAAPKLAAAAARPADPQAGKAPASKPAPKPAPRAEEPTRIAAVRIVGSGPIDGPLGGHWTKARPVTVTMLPQTVTLPHKADPAVKTLRVRALHNGGWIAFLIEWSDPTLSNRIVLDNFGDQVAIQLPVDVKATPPSPMMGNPGGRVNIMQWRAAFQRDLAEGPPTVRDLYPYAWADTYPDEVLSATDARPYTGALGLENPISRGRASPVLDQMAEGWGSMTVKPDQHALGAGVWRDGVWRVVITRPVVSDDVNAPRLAPGDRTVAAFAVWEGGNNEVGARKAWSAWIPLELTR